MAGKVTLRLIRSPDVVAKAVLEGSTGPEALLDDAVFDAALEQALGLAALRSARRLGQERQDRQLAVATRFRKGAPMSMFGINLDQAGQMTEAQLTLYIQRSEEGLAAASTPIEREQFQDAAVQLRKALAQLQANKQAAAQALLKADEPLAADAPPPEQNKGKGVDAQGKATYQYDKAHGGKGPGKQPTSTKKAPDADAAAAAAPTPPPAVDPSQLAKNIGVEEKYLKKFADGKTREQFIEYFQRFTGAVKKFNLTAQYLSALYDALTSPPAPPPAPAGAPGAAPGPAAGAPAAGAAPAKPGKPVAKAILHFVGRASDPQTGELLKALQERGVQNHEQMTAVVRSHFAVGDDEAIHLTRTLLRRWEAESVVDLTL